ncbi:MAG: cob(I)yrinic acid a,c-diamide adenosyltransferase [Candidatus Eisenbacteria bacterium]
MRIYTKQGDGGETGLLGGTRARKSDPRIRALGSLDEFNAALGLSLAGAEWAAELQAFLSRAQRVLFEAGAEVATLEPDRDLSYFAEETTWLEQWIDAADARLAPLDRFILPGGAPAGAWLHWTRTLCRRAEREVEEVMGGEVARAPLLAYLNRLSDALFVAARLANQASGRAEEAWTSGRAAGG